MKVYKVYVDKIFDYKIMTIGNILKYEEHDPYIDTGLGWGETFGLNGKGFYLYKVPDDADYECFSVDINSDFPTITKYLKEVTDTSKSNFITSLLSTIREDKLNKLFSYESIDVITNVSLLST